MFSGKTEELIRRLRRATIARQQVVVFKPALDTRYGAAQVVSHDSGRIESTAVHSAAQILSAAADADVVGIDEAQFFDEGLLAVVTALAGAGIRVIVAGLDMDFRGRPFGPMPQLMALAESVTKLSAVCEGCGAPATFSFRTTPEPDAVLLGEKDHYLPLCRDCYRRRSTA